MQNKTDNLTADIKKLIADIEQVDWKDECWPGYEQQAEENQESVLWNLTEAYNLAKKGNYDWAVETNLATGKFSNWPIWQLAN